MTPDPKPPVTAAEPVEEIVHGVTITDPYRWLEDQQSPRTREWIEAQNQYTSAVLGRVGGLEKLKQRLGELLRIDSVSGAYPAGGRVFSMKRPAGVQLFAIYLRRGADQPEELLVDPAPLSADQTTSVSLEDISDDGKLILYGVRKGGEDEIELVWLDVDAKRELRRLPRARYLGYAIEPDRRGAYYGVMRPEGPRIYHHRLDRGGDDPLVFGAGIGPESWITPSVSADGRWLLCEVTFGWDRSDLYLLDPARPGKSVHLTRGVQANFAARPAGRQVLVHTNWKAPRGRVMMFSWERPELSAWRELVPEGPHAIQEIGAGGGRVFVHAMEDAKSSLRVYEANGARLEDVPFPTPGTVTMIGGRWEEPDVYIGFTSFQAPHAMYRYREGRVEVFHAPGLDLDTSGMEMRQEWYASKDGTRIPMFLLHRKDLPRDGNQPVLLTGYGGFNQNMTPQFSALVRVWVEHGGVYALPNLRGGGEFGEEWHQAGMRERKQNVFDDFLAAAEWLIANRYTSPARLAIRGGSNGGLLVGAALTQRPELFRAVVCAVPLLDMVRYHHFLLARLWVPEYGSAENEAEFRSLHAYSPYHRVRKGVRYPAVLLLTGDADTRVDPLHARKMTALLQASTASDLPVLLRYDTKFGHTKSLPVSKVIEDTATELQFLMWQLGMRPQ